MISAQEQKKLLQHIQQTIEALEEILVAGLTTASQSTSKALAVTFQEAARLKLLRLGSTLRSTNEEITRYVKDDENFSQSRLMFFLHRSWVLCMGLKQAIKSKDKAQLEKLLWSPATDKFEKLEVICLGASKKIAAGNFCAFEFRLRAIGDGRPYTWSTVFPMKAGSEIPAEGYLHLPQKQKFTANVFLESSVVEITNALVSENPFGPDRIQLTEDSQVKSKDKFSDWDQYLNWSVNDAIQKIQAQQVSPLDVDIELQEEVVFYDYELDKPVHDKEQQRYLFPLRFFGAEFDVTVTDSAEGQAALGKLKSLQKKKNREGKLFGLMHYAKSRLVVRPLTVFDGEGQDYLTISEKSVDRRALLAALKFT